MEKLETEAGRIECMLWKMVSPGSCFGPESWTLTWGIHRNLASCGPIGATMEGLWVLYTNPPEPCTLAVPHDLEKKSLSTFLSNPRSWSLLMSAARVRFFFSFASMHVVSHWNIWRYQHDIARGGVHIRRGTGSYITSRAVRLQIRSRVM